MTDTEFNPNAYDVRFRQIAQAHPSKGIKSPARREAETQLDAEFRVALEADRCPEEFPQELRDALYRQAWDATGVGYANAAYNYSNLLKIAATAFRLGRSA